MDDDLDGIFSADLGEEEYEKNLPEEAAGTSQNHDPFFDNEVKPEEEGQKENRCMSYIKGKSKYVAIITYCLEFCTLPIVIHLPK